MHRPARGIVTEWIRNKNVHSLMQHIISQAFAAELRGFHQNARENCWLQFNDKFMSVM